MKRTLVKFHYEKMAKTGLKYKDIKMELSKKYGLVWQVLRRWFTGMQGARVPQSGIFATLRHGAGKRKKWQR